MNPKTSAPILPGVVDVTTVVTKAIVRVGEREAFILLTTIVGIGSIICFSGFRVYVPGPVSPWGAGILKIYFKCLVGAGTAEISKIRGHGYINSGIDLAF